MKKLNTNPLLALFTGLCMALTVTGCSSDEPGGGGGGGGEDSEISNRQPARANLRNVSALILYNGTDGSRAIDGDFERPGLYQLGPDGSVSMLAIYCSTDDEGNKIETQHSLTVHPGEIKSLSKNYAVLYSCEYYDEDGDPAGGVMASNLLINKSTGDIYNLDDVINAGIIGHGITGFYEEADGSLLIYDQTDRGNVGRLSFSGRKAAYNQLNNGKGFIYDWRGTGIHVTSQGLIFSSYLGLAEDMGVFFPNGGYDYLAGHTLPGISDASTTYEPEYDVDEHNKGFIWYDDAPMAVRQLTYTTRKSANEQFNESFFGVVRINVGNQSGQVTFTEGASIHLIEESISLSSLHNACVIGDNLLVELLRTGLYEYEKQRSYFLVYNSAANKWVNMESPIEFLRNDSWIQPDAVFDGRAWIVDVPEGAGGGKIWWINPATQQTGSLDVSLAGVDVESIEGDYLAGRLVIRGIRRSDSHNCVLTFDLKTGKSETIFSSPNLAKVELMLLN